jgi:hypothetical protein
LVLGPAAPQEVNVMNARTVLLRIAPVVVLAAALVLAPAALAKGPSGGGANSGSSLSLVLMNSSDGLPHWDQNVTFNVSTAATSTPFVRLNCSQNGVWVYTSTVGYFPSYPWWQYFTLSNGQWTNGAADCTATLYYVSGTHNRETDLAKLGFHVYA